LLDAPLLKHHHLMQLHFFLCSSQQITRQSICWNKRFTNLYKDIPRFSLYKVTRVLPEAILEINKVGRLGVT